MKSKAHDGQTDQERLSPAKGSKKTRGGYGDAKAATAQTKNGKLSAKEKGGGYGDAKIATEKEQKRTKSKPTEKTRKPF